MEAKARRPPSPSQQGGGGFSRVSTHQPPLEEAASVERDEMEAENEYASAPEEAMEV